MKPVVKIINNLEKPNPKNEDRYMWRAEFSLVAPQNNNTPASLNGYAVRGLNSKDNLFVSNLDFISRPIFRYPILDLSDNKIDISPLLIHFLENTWYDDYRLYVDLSNNPGNFQWVEDAFVLKRKVHAAMDECLANREEKSWGEQITQFLKTLGQYEHDLSPDNPFAEKMDDFFKIKAKSIVEQISQKINLTNKIDTSDNKTTNYNSIQKYQGKLKNMLSLVCAIDSVMNASLPDNINDNNFKSKDLSLEQRLFLNTYYTYNKESIRLKSNLVNELESRTISGYETLLDAIVEQRDAIRKSRKLYDNTSYYAAALNLIDDVQEDYEKILDQYNSYMLTTEEDNRSSRTMLYKFDQARMLLIGYTLSDIHAQPTLKKGAAFFSKLADKYHEEYNWKTYVEEGNLKKAAEELYKNASKDNKELALNLIRKVLPDFHSRHEQQEQLKRGSPQPH